MALLYGRAGRLTAKNGGFWLGQGVVSAAIRDLQAYQMMDNSSESNVNSIQWGALWTLEVLLGFVALSIYRGTDYVSESAAD
jgi:hypothetical protein